MNTKDLFQTKKPLRNWWAHTVDDPMWGEVLLHARSAFIEMGPSEAELKGARIYEQLLTALAEADDLGAELPNPGLIHHVDQAPPMPHAPTPSPKPQPKQLKAKRK